jgi:hypothetical protein
MDTVERAPRARRTKRLVLGSWAGMPGHVPAAAASAGSWPSGDFQSSMAATMDPSTTIVKPAIDPKGPLKGKGESLAQWRADAHERLQQVYAAMHALAAESRSIAGRSFGLNVYSLRSGRQLRWRMTSGRHATWERVELLLDAQPAGLARWYRLAQEQALILNHREQVLRYEVKTVDRLIALGAPRAARAYRSTVGRGAGGGRPQGITD